MRSSIKRGFGFGVTSGIITTLGLMVGLYAGTDSKFVVLSGIASIAVADAFSDALGMHISEEAGDNRSSKREIWESTISTFLFKLLFASFFIIPVLVLNLKTAIITSVILGITLIALFSYKIALSRKSNPWRAIAEHVFIGIVVVIITYFVGKVI